MGDRRWWYLLLVVPVVALSWLPSYARIEPRLIGILQTLPSALIGLYTRRLPPRVLLAGGRRNDRGDVDGGARRLRLAGIGLTVFDGFPALALNLLVAVGGTLLLRGLGHRDDRDETLPADYL